MLRDQEVLSHRIERLEREARRWRCAAVVLGGVLAAIGLLGATTAGPVPVADEIRARRFVLVDGVGRVRADLRSSSDNPKGTVFELYAPDQVGGLPRVVLASSSDLAPDVGPSNAPGLTVFGDRGAFAALTVSRDGAVLNLAHGSRKTSALLAAHARSSALLLSDDTGTPRLALGNTALVPVVMTLESRGLPRAVVERLSRLPPEEQERAIKKVVKDQLRPAMEAPWPASSLVLFDKDGKVLFKAP